MVPIWLGRFVHLDCSENRPKSSKLDLQSEMFFNLLAAAVQTKLDVIISTIVTMEQGRVPDLNASPNTTFYNEFRLRLGYF